MRAPSSSQGTVHAGMCFGTRESLNAPIVLWHPQ